MNRWTVWTHSIDSHLVVIEEILERSLEVVSDSEVTPDWRFVRGVDVEWSVAANYEPRRAAAVHCR